MDVALSLSLGRRFRLGGRKTSALHARGRVSGYMLCATALCTMSSSYEEYDDGGGGGGEQ